MANPFDAFDEKPAAKPANVFDQFDEMPSKEDGSVTATNVARGVARGVPVVGGVLNKLNAATNAALEPLVPQIVSDAIGGTRIPGSNFSERYENELKRQEGMDKAFEEQSPIASTASEIGGAVAGTIPMIAAAPAAFGISNAPMLGRVAASGLSGAALSGADAAVRSEGDADKTKTGAAIGVAIGAAAPYVGAAIGAVGRSIGNRLAPVAVPTLEELEAAANAAYRRSEEAGVRVAQPAFKEGVESASAAAKEAGIDKTIHPKATAAIGRLEEAVGSEPSLKEIDILRRIVGGAAKSLEPDERRIAGVIMRRLDGMVDGLTPGQVATGNAEEGVAALKEARQLWSMSRKSEIISDALDEARLRAASSGSGGNIDNAQRQAFKNILLDEKVARGFSDSELAQMRRIVEGTPSQNIARMVGRAAPNTGALPLIANLTASGASGGLTLPLSALATGGKVYSDAVTRKAIDTLGRSVRAGGDIPESSLAAILGPRARKLGQGAAMSSLPVSNQRR